MALWIRNRPPERCHRAEVEVAEFLADLSNDWVIRWGFSYCDNSGIQREGDFLVLGPRGGLLVIEVKSGSIIHNPYTGVWNTADGDNPQLQLDAEWKAVVNTINDCQDSRPSLHVGRALGTPDLSLQPGVQEHYGIAREFILDRGDLRRFEESWQARMVACLLGTAPPQRRCQGRHLLRCRTETVVPQRSLRSGATPGQTPVQTGPRSTPGNRPLHPPDPDLS